MNLKMRLKNSRGITLIALVVTIIILLILAGISITMLTGQNGILNRAQEAKNKTEQAQEDEKEKITAMEAMVQSAGTAVTNPSSYGENPNAQATSDGTGKYFALPTGASYVTGTVDTGVVVNIKESEFVWVPVDDVVLDTSKVEELPTSSENGTESGKTYTPMAVKVGDNYKGILYSYSGSNSYLKYASNQNYQGNESEYREPDIVNSYDIEDYKEEGITEELLTTEYNAMIESVKKYKGFYVARYEAGLDKTTNEIVFKNASVEANNVATTDENNELTKMWYGLYRKIKTFATSENNEDKIVSSMMWGSQYDAMLNWMAKTGIKVGIADSLKTNTDLNKVTGSSAVDVINNIYDLYGCHYEWTLEAYNTTARVCRGGNFNSSNSPAFKSYDNPDSTNSIGSSRATLYIK